MSGLEVAGIVLGAFPLAIAAVTEYGKAAKRLRQWYNIGLEHQKCRDELTFHRVILIGHLRQLLQPLVSDETQLEGLLSNPGDTVWKEASLDIQLRDRLGLTYELYFTYITGIRHVMEKLNEELEIDSKTIRERVDVPKISTAGEDHHLSSIKDKAQLFLYRTKFSHGETTRKDLFRQLQDYNDKLEKLLSSRSTSVFQTQQRTSKNQLHSLDSTICDFWKEALKLFKALNCSWNCSCDKKHDAKLLLQHRSYVKSEFIVMFETLVLSSWDLYKMKILEDPLQSCESTTRCNTVSEVITIHQPTHRQTRSIKSALRSKIPNSQVKPLGGLSVRHKDEYRDMSIVRKLTRPLSDHTTPLRTLCIPRKQGRNSCWGFVRGENCCYSIHELSHQSVQNVTYITLDQILRGQVLPPPSRRRRYALSLILASSFLQLIDTPWLPMVWNRTNIVFYGNTSQPDVLGEPHLSRNVFVAPNDESDELPKDGPMLADSFHELGIMLLELCFGKTLEEHPHRKEFRTGENDSEKKGFDLLAALTWQNEVVEEAGQDYSTAVEWCLGKIKPNKWGGKCLRMWCCHCNGVMIISTGQRPIHKLQVAREYDIICNLVPAK